MPISMRSSIEVDRVLDSNNLFNIAIATILYCCHLLGSLEATSGKQVVYLIFCLDCRHIFAYREVYLSKIGLFCLFFADFLQYFLRLIN